MKKSSGFYLRRPTDEALLQAAKRWLAGDVRTHRISLASAPGRGNTSLLDNFVRESAQQQYSLNETLIVFVRGSEALPSEIPKRLLPIASGIYRSYEKSQATWLARFGRRIRVSRTDYLRMLVLAGMIWTALAFLQLLDHGDSIHLLNASWWRMFWANYLVGHPTAVFFKFLIVIVGESLVHLLFKKFKPEEEEPAGAGPSGAELRRFKDYKQVVAILAELCRGYRAAVMVIDDAPLLPPEDALFLQRFFDSELQPATRQFLERHRFMAITLDATAPADAKTGPKKDEPKTILVPEFNKLEIRDIYLRNHKTPAGAGSEKTAYSGLDPLFERAQHNVKLLFEDAISELTEELEKEFLNAKPATGGPDPIEDVFGHREMMAYWAASQQPNVSKKRLFDWIATLDSGHLRLFGLAMPERKQELVDTFSRSKLVRAAGQILYFDAQAREALCKWMRKDHGSLLAQSHFYWCGALAKDIFPAGTQPSPVQLTLEKQVLIKQAAWHTSSIGIILETGPEVLPSAGLTAQQLLAHQQCMLGLLLHSAGVWRDEGNVKESDASVMDALEWLSAVEGKEQCPWADFAAYQLWMNYWSAGSSETRKKLQSELLAKAASLANGTPWLIHLRFEELLQGRAALSQLKEQPAANQPELLNLSHLTEALWEIRQKHGFLSSGLEDTAISMPKPEPAANANLVESSLWQLKAEACHSRRLWNELDGVLGDWRARSSSSSKNESYLADELVREFDTARYWHILAECWETKINAIPKPGADEREPGTGDNEVVGWAKQHIPAAPDGDDSMAPSLLYFFEQARARYDSALQIAVLLQWRPFLVEVSFHLGRLLLAFTPRELRQPDPPWWEVWETLFQSCLQNENILGWNMRSPEVHLARWKFFFDEEDRPTSINDGYNVFQAIQAAHYPIEQILEWHALMSTLLHDYGHTADHHKKSGELHEIWARSLAAHPGAVKSRHFKHCLAYEQASALDFAAQAARRIEDFEHAEKLLDEVDHLIQQGKSDPAAQMEDVRQVENFIIGSRMERAWLLEAEGHTTAAHQLIREIWRDASREGEHSANLLGTLVDAEEKERLLANPWPDPQSAPHIDPANNDFSLPESWFQGEESLHLGNRFEFRFLQLIHLISRSRQPSRWELRVGAMFGWHQYERFAETALRLANVGLQHPYVKSIIGTIIPLLEEVAFYFEHVEPNHQLEIRTCRMLMQYSPGVPEYKSKYEEVLKRHKELLKRELRALSLDRSQWFNIAAKMEYYLSLLVDSEMKARRIAQWLSKNGTSVEQFRAAMDALAAAVERAQRHYTHGEYRKAIQELDPVLPAPKAGWVSLRDVECIDLWLKCAARVHGIPEAETNRRAAQLRESVFQYIGQFRWTISAKDIQDLALELLEAVQPPSDFRVPRLTAASTA